MKNITLIAVLTIIYTLALNVQFTFSQTVRSGAFNLTWQDNSDNEQGFVLERRIGSTYTQIGKVGTNVTFFRTPLMSFLEGETVCFAVYAFNAAGSSSRAEACTTTPIGTPKDPSDLNIQLDVTTLTSSSLGLGWQPSDSAFEVVAYQIELNDHPNALEARWRLEAATLASVQTHTFTGLRRNSNYHARVRACDANSNCSPYSNSVSVRTLR